MLKDYEEKMDELFCKESELHWKHRTLRTIFDYGSYEWDQTQMKEKIEIYTLIDKECCINVLLLQYKERYKGKAYMINSIGISLEKILSFSLDPK